MYSLSDHVWTQLALAQLSNFSDQANNSELVEELADVGDLHCLSVLNEKKVSGASEMYNKVLEEPVFLELFHGNTSKDDAMSRDGSHTRSSLPGSAGWDGLLLLQPRRAAANDQADDQDLAESIFVGRRGEIGAFRMLLKRMEHPEEEEYNEDHLAASLAVGAIAISGPSGIGKTALLDEFALVAHETEAEMTVLRGSCRAGEKQTSWFPFREVFGPMFKMRRTG